MGEWEIRVDCVGPGQWGYGIYSENGRPMLTAYKYASKRNAIRAAKSVLDGIRTGVKITDASKA